MIRYLAFCLFACCLFPCSARASQQAPPELSGLLMDAVRTGDEKTVQSLLARGARANTRKEPWDATALEVALGREWFGDEFNDRIANQLMDKGDTPESIFPGDYRALSEGVRRGDRYLLKRLLLREYQSDYYSFYSQIDTWRILTIATLKEDVPMLKAVGECLPREAVWNIRQLSTLHPLEIAIRFSKKKAFDQFMIPPFFSKEMLQECQSGNFGRDDSGFNNSIADALLGAIENGSDIHVEALLNLIPGLMDLALSSNSIRFDKKKNQILTDAIIKFPPGLLTRLWRDGTPEIGPLLGRTGAYGWEDHLFMLGARPKGTWKAMAKLHAMGSRPGLYDTFSRFVDFFQKGELSVKEFEELLGPMGTWPLEPNDPVNLLGWGTPRCIEAFGDPDILRIMLRASVPIRNWRDAQGRSLLHHAAQFSGTVLNNGFMVSSEKYLMPLVHEASLDINIPDTSGQPAVAYIRPLKDFVRFVESGARVEWPMCPEGHALNRWIANYRGWSLESDNLPAYADSDWLKSNTFRLKMKPLLNMAAGENRRTPLTTACEIPQQYARQHFHWEGTFDLKARMRETPEAKKQREEKERRKAEEKERAWQSLRDPLIALLLDAGADADLADGRGWTPARAAVESNDLVRLRTLISHPKGLRCTDREGLLSALVRGPGSSHEALLALLKKHGVGC